MIDIDAAARALYDACPTVKPTWDQLGEVTKSVWRERAQPVDFGFDLGTDGKPDVIPSEFFHPEDQGVSMSKFNIVQFQAATGLPLTAEFISKTLGVEPDPELTVKRAVWWREGQFSDIMKRLSAYVANRAKNDPTTFSPDRPKKAPEDAGKADASTGDGFSFGDETPPAGNDFDFGGETKAEDSGFDFGGDAPAENEAEGFFS